MRDIHATARRCEYTEVEFPRKKRPFLHRNCDKPAATPWFFPLSPDFSRLRPHRQREPGQAKTVPFSGGKRPLFTSPGPVPLGDFSGFSVAERGGAPPQKIPPLGPSRLPQINYKCNNNIYLCRQTVTTEKSISLPARGQDVTTSACRRHKRLAVCRFPFAPRSGRGGLSGISS